MEEDKNNGPIRCSHRPKTKGSQNFTFACILWGILFLIKRCLINSEGTSIITFLKVI